MGAKCVFRFIYHRLFEGTIVVLLILYLPNLPPYSNFTADIRLPPTKPFTGKLALNEKLKDVEIWHKSDFVGPEAFAHYSNELYTSLMGGNIIKLVGNHVIPVAKTGKPCKAAYEERLCGRPLGLTFDKNGTLYAVDAYYGILKINIKTGEKDVLVSPDEEVGGKKAKLFNSIALANNGDLFWTDSNSEFLLEDGLFTGLADPSGRLIHYDAKTRKNKVLLDKLSFANGIQLSDDEEFIIVAETMKSRIQRYYLKGSRRGAHDIFIDGLPGIPDNLGSDGKGAFLIPLLIAVDEDHPFIFQTLSEFPLVRKFFARVLRLSQLAFETIDKVYPAEFAKRAVHFIGHFTSIPHLQPSRTTIIRVSKYGEILDSLHTLDKKLSSISEAHIFDNYLYLGSPFNDFIGRIPLLKIGWEHLSNERQKLNMAVEQPTEKGTVPTLKRQTTATTQQATTIPTTTPLPKQQVTPQKADTSKEQTPSLIRQTLPSQQNSPLKKEPDLQEQRIVLTSQEELHSKPPNQSPTQQTTFSSPQNIPPNPQTPPPTQETIAPKQKTIPPTQQTQPPKKQRSPLVQQTPVLEQQTRTQQTVPTKRQTPTPIQQTLRPKQETAQSKQHTPPPTQNALPQKQHTPLQKQQAQPSKQQTHQTPQSKQQISSKAETTPLKQANLPYSPHSQNLKSARYQKSPRLSQPVKDVPVDDRMKTKI